MARVPVRSPPAMFHLPHPLRLQWFRLARPFRRVPRRPRSLPAPLQLLPAQHHLCQASWWHRFRLLLLPLPGHRTQGRCRPRLRFRYQSAFRFRLQVLPRLRFRHSPAWSARHPLRRCLSCRLQIPLARRRAGPVHFRPLLPAQRVAARRRSQQAEPHMPTERGRARLLSEWEERIA